MHLHIHSYMTPVGTKPHCNPHTWKNMIAMKYLSYIASKHSLSFVSEAH